VSHLVLVVSKLAAARWNDRNARVAAQTLMAGGVSSLPAVNLRHHHHPAAEGDAPHMTNLLQSPPSSLTIPPPTPFSNTP
jgi:hypothetical protein